MIYFCEMQQKIVLIGGPGTGKTSVLNALIQKGFFCMHEVSREVTLKAKEDGIDQLFLTAPLLFSEKLLEGRERQYHKASETAEEIVFFDRGIPDIIGYLNNANQPFFDSLINTAENHKYDFVFILPPWKEIYKTDNERREDFFEATKLFKAINDAYIRLGYQTIEVPKLTVKERIQFILDHIK